MVVFIGVRLCLIGYAGCPVKSKRCFDLTFNGGGMRLIFWDSGASAYDDVG